MKISVHYDQCLEAAQVVSRHSQRGDPCVTQILQILW
jgi:hypothetical protein